MVMSHKKRPAIDGSDRQPHRGDNQETLVNNWIRAIAEGKGNQGREYQHVAERNGEERLRIKSGRPGSPCQSVGGSQQPKNDHQARPEERRHPQAPVNVNAPRRYQRCLRDQQQDPNRKDCAVQVNDQTWQGRAKDTRQIVRSRESRKDCRREQQGHGGKEQMIELPARQSGFTCGNTARACRRRHSSTTPALPANGAELYNE